MIFSFKVVVELNECSHANCLKQSLAQVRDKYMLLISLTIVINVNTHPSQGLHHLLLPVLKLSNTCS